MKIYSFVNILLHVVWFFESFCLSFSFLFRNDLIIHYSFLHILFQVLLLFVPYYSFSNHFVSLFPSLFKNDSIVHHYSLLLIIHCYSLFIVVQYYSSFIIHYSSFIIHHSSFIIYMSLFIIRHLSLIIYYSSFINHHSLFIRHYSLLILHILFLVPLLFVPYCSFSNHFVSFSSLLRNVSNMENLFTITYFIPCSVWFFKSFHLFFASLFRNDTLFIIIHYLLFNIIRYSFLLILFLVLFVPYCNFSNYFESFFSFLLKIVLNMENLYIFTYFIRRFVWFF